jgi:hypothetical protein
MYRVLYAMTSLATINISLMMAYIDQNMWDTYLNDTELVGVPLFFFQCHHMSLMNFVVPPPGWGRSVNCFWGWDAHEAQLRCPD